MEVGGVRVGIRSQKSGTDLHRRCDLGPTEAKENNKSTCAIFPAQVQNERMATLTLESDASVGVGRKHHLLRRCSHCLSVPIFLASS